jgi:uncharacterized protein
MKWTIQQLKTLKDTGLSFDQTVDVSEITERDSEVRKVSPVRVRGNAIFENEKVSFPLEITGEMVLPSSKTLADVDYPFHLHTFEVFRLGPSASLEEDEELHDVEDGVIELLPYVKEAILVEKPIRVVSENEEHQPLQSGKDWELVSEEQKNNRIDPRLKELEKLLDDNRP